VTCMEIPCPIRCLCPYPQINRHAGGHVAAIHRGWAHVVAHRSSSCGLVGTAVGPGTANGATTGGPPMDLSYRISSLCQTNSQGCRASGPIATPEQTGRNPYAQ
jgi:hypothetical protein